MLQTAELVGLLVERVVVFFLGFTDKDSATAGGRGGMRAWMHAIWGQEGRVE